MSEYNFSFQIAEKQRSAQATSLLLSLLCIMSISHSLTSDNHAGRVLAHNLREYVFNGDDAQHILVLLHLQKDHTTKCMH